jgi:hypothetical protein
MNNTSNNLEVRWMAAAGLERNGVDVHSFLAQNNLPSPWKESVKCLREHENWDDRFDTLRYRKVYTFDVYTHQCIQIRTIGGFTPAEPVDMYEKALEILETLNPFRKK